MCLIVVGWRSHPDYPLVVAANRDEFFARPSSPIARWPDAPQVIGGLDLEAGGTWLGITESGRFAAVTNVREPGMAKGDCSRGTLTRDFLTANTSADNFAAQIDCRRYSGFNLLLGDGDSLVYYSNRDTPAPAGARHLWPFQPSAGQPMAKAAGGAPAFWRSPARLARRVGVFQTAGRPGHRR